MMALIYPCWRLYVGDEEIRGTYLKKCFGRLQLTEVLRMGDSGYNLPLCVCVISLQFYDISSQVHLPFITMY